VWFFPDRPACRQSAQRRLVIGTDRGHIGGGEIKKYRRCTGRSEQSTRDANPRSWSSLTEAAAASAIACIRKSPHPPRHNRRRSLEPLFAEVRTKCSFSSFPVSPVAARPRTPGFPKARSVSGPSMGDHRRSLFSFVIPTRGPRDSWALLEDVGLLRTLLAAMRARRSHLGSGKWR